MTKEEHIKVHKRLHSSLDELVSDFIVHDGMRQSLGDVSVMKLIQWSAGQKVEPNEEN